MRKAIEVVRTDLKCDAAGCGHVETFDGPAENHIDKPCPRCGASLLTREDYEAMVRAMAAVDLVNELFEIPADAPEHDDGTRLIVNPHAGDVNITIKRAS